MHGSQAQESRDERTKHFTETIIIQNETASQYKMPKEQVRQRKYKNPNKVPAVHKAPVQNKNPAQTSRMPTSTINNTPTQTWREQSVKYT